MRFSERIGKRQIKVEIQLNYMDKDLLNGLWNVITVHILEPMRREKYIPYSDYDQLVKLLWLNHFKEPLDEIPYSTLDIRVLLRERYFSWNYLEVYDFIDFIASVEHQVSPIIKQRYIKNCNEILKRELSGYRFVNNQLAPITNELEINSIESAINDSLDNNFKGVNLHLTEALNKLSDKSNPDYRNSIKESISAVESACQQITGDTKSELGKVLKKLDEVQPIHKALSQGFMKIYGYTSDSNGIRHAMMEKDKLDQEDALYMLVACSAFSNYLMAKANKMKVK